MLEHSQSVGMIIIQVYELGDEVGGVVDETFHL